MNENNRTIKEAEAFWEGYSKGTEDTTIVLIKALKATNTIPPEIADQLIEIVKYNTTEKIRREMMRVYTEHEEELERCRLGIDMLKHPGKYMKKSLPPFNEGKP